MTIEEKAEAYDKALERAKSISTNTDIDTVLTVSKIFPELVESKDENIIKEICDFICWSVDNGSITKKQRERYNYWIDWLEKQGKQKQMATTQELKPKFKVGDWIVCCDYEPVQIIDITSEMYDWSNGDSRPIEMIDNNQNIHLWSIEDAKDGDVLAFYSEYRGNEMAQVGIIEKYVGKHGGCSNTFKIYVGVNWENNLQIGEYMGCSDIRPATQEQRELLFTKMKEAGYEWDSEKKELKKIEQKPTDKVEPKFKAGNWYLCVKDFYGKGVRFDKGHAYHCGLNGCLQEFDSGAHIDIDKNLYDYFNLWTIEDAKDGDVFVNQNGELPFIFKEHKDNYIYCYCGYTNRKDIFFDRFVDNKGEELHWLNLCHEQVYPATQEQRELLFTKMKEAGYEWDSEKKELKKIEQNSAWSEENERKITELKAFISKCNGFNKSNREKAFNMIDSIKPQNTWKPSRFQMAALYDIRRYAEEGDIKRTLLQSLYNDLKNLQK